ncbi:MAG: agglutinin biogenesis protein MshI [Gammaproteobacteria bacterium]|nr:agglutinin biogenesis protein MshI [Gammaproteobacteria bacterium]
MAASSGQAARGGAALFSFLTRKPKRDGLVGVSLTPDGVALAHVRRNGGPPRLAVAEHRACSPGQRDAVLGELVKAHRLQGAPSVVSLWPGDYHLLQVEAPDVEASELRSAVRWRIKDLIDFHVDDAVIDVFEIPGQGQPGRARMMYTVAARTSTIRAGVELVASAGLDLQAIDIAELALRNISERLPEADQGLALLAFIADEVLLTLVRDGELYLSRSLEITPQALAAAGAASVDHVVLELQRSFDYYESHFGHGGIGAVRLGPGVEDGEGLGRALAEALGVPVRTVALDELVELEREPDPLARARCLPAVGAALRSEEVAL